MTAKRDGEKRRGAMAAAASDRLIASNYLKRTEDLFARQRCQTLEEVRPFVAGKLSISVSAAEFIRRMRRQIVPSWLKERIVALFIEAAQAELRAIEHEIDVARQIGLGNHDGKLVAARSRAAQLVQLLDCVVTEGSGATAP